MTVEEIARLGGKATARKLTAKQRKESARKAAKAGWEAEYHPINWTRHSVRLNADQLAESRIQCTFQSLPVGPESVAATKCPFGLPLKVMKVRCVSRQSGEEA